MKKDMLLRLAFIAMLFWANPSLSQSNNYSYEYDDAGNRNHRFINLSSQRTANNTVGELEHSAFVNHFPQQLITESFEGNSLTVSIYPNPTADRVHVQYDQEGVLTREMQVVDVKGKTMIRDENLDGDFEVPFESFSKGNYYLLLNLDGEIKKFLVIKN